MIFGDQQILNTQISILIVIAIAIALVTATILSSKKRHKADKKTVESLVNLIKDAAEKLKYISKNNPELYEMAISKLL